MDTKSRLKNALKLVVDNTQPSNNQSIVGNNNQQISTAKHSGNTQSINGDNNTQVAGDVYITQPVISYSENAVPGSQHITEEQAYQIRYLVHEIVKWEKQAKINPRSFAAVWASFKKKYKVTEYKFLPKEQYNNAISYLNQTIGRLTKNKTARKSSDWRKRRYAFIHTNVKQLGILTEMRRLLQSRFNTDSMKHITDEELEYVYAWVNKVKQS